VIRGKKLLRKLWNVEQFIQKTISTEPVVEQPSQLTLIDQWILSKYSELIKKTTLLMDNYNFSQAIKEVEYFLWHEFADHYIEMAKSSIYTGNNKESVIYTLETIGLGLIKLFAPFFPHITEELYHSIYHANDERISIHLSSWPEPVLSNSHARTAGEIVKDYIAAVRSFKSEQGIALNAPLQSTATYADESLITALQENKLIITETLKLPDTHTFHAGKPDVKEEITDLIPVYATIGPRLKNKSKDLITWLSKNKDSLIQHLEETGDLTWNDIPLDVEEPKTDSLIENEFIKIKRETKIQGITNQKVIQLENFYLLVSSEMIPSK
jgi:valyl-tRNA synthetase